MKNWGILFGIMALLTVSPTIIAQEDDEDDFRTEAEKKADREAAEYWDNLEDDEIERKGFFAGIYVGALFADKYSAHLYDGYGFERDGTKITDFARSWMYQSLLETYGKEAIGRPDRIAQELNVGPGEYEFNASDMPVNLKYNIAFSFGLHGRYHFDDRNALLFNINFSKLVVNGQFTIEKTNSIPVSAPSDPGGINYSDQVQRFGIRGEEQRVMLQAGYQRILGKNQLLNPLIELGVDLTFAKFDGLNAEVNSLVMNLEKNFDRYGNLTEEARNLTGVGVGAFGGLGLQLELGGKWTMQLVYDLVFQKIDLSNDTKYGLHHNIGLRAIYNI